MGGSESDGDRQEQSGNAADVRRLLRQTNLASDSDDEEFSEEDDEDEDGDIDLDALASSMPPRVCRRSAETS